MNSEISELIADVKEQVLYMQELGVELLSAELPDTAPGEPERYALPKPAVETFERYVPDELPIVKKPVIRPEKTGSRVSVLPSLGKRTKAATPEIPDAQIPKITPQKEILPPRPITERSFATIDEVRAFIGDCTRCPLHLGRKQIVHSTGNFTADLMFVGEAPGADEDEKGEPFVGRAGKLLTQIIEAIGMKREDVFIGNINRCRPPGNRTPVPEETARCRPFLLAEIEVVKPQVIVVLGATAAHNLLQVKTPIGQLRGNFHDYFGVKVMPTFHPAYLLRDPHKKREVWEDMKKVREFLAT